MYNRDVARSYQFVMETRWLTAKQIAFEMGYHIGGVQAVLRRYEKQGLVVRRPPTSGRTIYWSWG